MVTRRPKFSAIVITRDRPQLLADGLRSISAQMTPPLEVRITDDGDQPLDPTSLPGALLQVVVIPGGTASARRREIVRPWVPRVRCWHFSTTMTAGCLIIFRV